MKNIFIVSTIFLSLECFAASAGSRPPMQVYLGAVLNFGLVALLFIWKARPALSSHFNAKNQEIKNFAKSVSDKKMKAEKMYKEQLEKNNNLEKEIIEIQSQAKRDIDGFRAELSRETEDKVVKLKKDLNNKIEVNKQNELKNINNELVEKIIGEVRENIKVSDDKKFKAIEKQIRGLL